MTTTKHGLAEVNGAQIYYEIRGSGPPLLLIMGLTGDAGWFEPLAELLAKQFTVVTYDRRANSRSPRPEGWTSTSIAEQADDAAGLLSALRLSPAIVFGNSFGAMILLELIIRHPRSVRGAVAHEPPHSPTRHSTPVSHIRPHSPQPSHRDSSTSGTGIATVSLPMDAPSKNNRAFGSSTSQSKS